MKKINQFLSIKLAIVFGLFFLIAACTEDDGFVVDTSDIVPGEILGDASTLSIANTESVTFTDKSTKVQSRAWTFQGGTPATSTDSIVTVSYVYGGTFTAELTVTHIDNTIQTKEFVVEVSGPTGPGQTPYLGEPVSLPGIIEFENYDVGGQDVAYSDTEEDNLAVLAGSATYREDDGIDIEVSADGSLVNIGYSGPDEWMEYTVDVTTAGKHYFKFSVASGSDTGGSSVIIQAQNGDEFSDLGETGDFDATAGWSSYEDLIVTDIELAEGEQVLRFYLTGGGVNLDKVEVVAGDFDVVPEVDALASSLAIFEGQTVTFTDNSTLVDTRNWTFEGGDPAASTDAEVAVSYANAGTFEATIDITHTDGSTGSQTFEIVVSESTSRTGNLVLYSETTPFETQTDVTVQNNNMVEITPVTEGAFEGDEAYYFKYVFSANGYGLHATLNAEPTALDATGYENGFYNVAIKTTCVGKVKIRMRGNGTDYWVMLDDAVKTYGLERDGEWHVLKIPVSDFKANDRTTVVNLASLSNVFVLRSDEGSATPGDGDDYDFYVDDIYFSLD